MNPVGFIVIAVGIILVYIGVKGNPHAVVTGLQQAYGKVPGANASAVSASTTSINRPHPNITHSRASSAMTSATNPYPGGISGRP